MMMNFRLCPAVCDNRPLGATSGKTSQVYLPLCPLTFSYAGPAAWNSLPDHIQSITNTASFKRQLKTFMFSACSYY